MWTSIVLGLARTFGAVFSGWLISKGIDGDTATAVVGAVTAIGVAGSSVLDKMKRA
jgi:hypothetical protein